VIGEVGVVTGVAAIRGIERKEQVDLTVRYTAVYAKRDGRWQLTAGSPRNSCRTILL
jgi:ketosteroid isomerase-like protein